jgi:hypothetical protein
LSKIQENHFNTGGANFSKFEWGDFTQTTTKEALAHHVTKTWLKKLCNDRKR